MQTITDYINNSDSLCNCQVNYSAQYTLTTLSKLFTPLYHCHQAVSFGTSQRAVMICDQER